MTTELQKELEAKGVQIKPRRLESWSLERLGPSPTLPYERQLEHYACLATLSTSGRTADDVATGSAARGFANERALGVVHRSLGTGSDITQEGTAEIDIGNAPSGDNDFADLEQIAVLTEQNLKTAPKPLRHLFETLQRNIELRADSLEDTPEQAFHSFIVNIFSACFGGSVYNHEAFTAAMGDDPSAIKLQAFDAMNQMFQSMSLEALITEYRSVSTEELAVGAQASRVLFSSFIENPNSQLTENDLDWISVMFAPALKAIVENPDLSGPDVANFGDAIPKNTANSYAKEIEP